MARRHVTGFEVLGLNADPTPGDPEALLGVLVTSYTSLGDDAATAADVLAGQAVADGRGETMDKLREVVGTEYPEKLRTAATSFRGAADAYRTYARTLAETQTEVDRAMDQALPVAVLAAETPPEPPGDADADQRRSAQERTAQIGEARGVLDGARRLAGDAKALRDQAAGALRDELEHVAVVPERSLFEKFLEWFKNNPVLQILLGVVVGIVSIFFPIVGFALGAVTFGLLTAFNTLATGKLDIGALVVGILTLGFGAGMAAIRLIPGIGAQVGRATSGAGRFLTSLPGPVGPGLRTAGQAVRARPALERGLLGGTEGFVPGVVINSIGGAINQKNGTPFNATVIFAGALAGGVAGGGGAALVSKFGPGLNSAFTRPGAGPAPSPAPAPAPAPVPSPAPAPSVPPQAAAVSRPSSPAPSVYQTPPSSPTSPGSPTPSVFETPPSSPISGSRAPSRPGSPTPPDGAAPPSPTTSPSADGTLEGSPVPERPPAVPAPSGPTPASTSGPDPATTPNEPTAPANSATTPGPAPAGSPAEGLSTADKVTNSGVIGVSVAADGGTKVGVTEAQNAAEEEAQLVGQEATGGQAGLAAGSPTNRIDPLSRSSFGRIGR